MADQTKKTKAFEEILNSEGNMKLKQIIKEEHDITCTYENWEVLEEYDSVSTLKAVLMDNTATNTGYKSGLVVNLEKLLGRKLQTIGCLLHWNELPMRAVFKSIYGESTGLTTFSGTIGKLCAIDQHDKPLVKCKPIETCMIELPPEVVQDLSTDQRMVYEYTLGIREGKINPVYVSRKCGPLNHLPSGWSWYIQNPPNLVWSL